MNVIQYYLQLLLPFSKVLLTEAAYSEPRRTDTAGPASLGVALGRGVAGADAGGVRRRRVARVVRELDHVEQAED